MNQHDQTDTFVGEAGAIQPELPSAKRAWNNRLAAQRDNRELLLAERDILEDAVRNNTVRETLRYRFCKTQALDHPDQTMLFDGFTFQR